MICTNKLLGVRAKNVKGQSTVFVQDFFFIHFSFKYKFLYIKTVSNEISVRNRSIKNNLHQISIKINLLKLLFMIFPFMFFMVIILCLSYANENYVVKVEVVDKSKTVAFLLIQIKCS